MLFNHRRIRLSSISSSTLVCASIARRNANNFGFLAMMERKLLFLLAVLLVFSVISPLRALIFQHCSFVWCISTSIFQSSHYVFILLNESPRLFETMCHFASVTSHELFTVQINSDVNSSQTQNGAVKCYAIEATSVLKK